MNALPDEPTGSEPDVEEQFLARERAAELHAVVGRLKPEQQHLLALRYGAGLAFDEIAEVVGGGIPMTTEELELRASAREAVP